MDRHIRSFFRTSFISMIVGVVLTLIVQFIFFPTPSARHPNPGLTNGPAERVGVALDRGLSGLGKLTERAGQKMQDVTANAVKEKHEDVAQEKVVQDKVQADKDVPVAKKTEEDSSVSDTTNDEHSDRSLRQLLNPPPDIGAR